MAEPGSGTQKPAVLIIGGLGYIGRFLAQYIHKNDLASEVRLVDKVLPQLAFLADEFSEACSVDKFMQADARNEQSLSRIFTPKTAKEYTYVFNCGGETRYSQEDSVYEARIVQLSKAVARECALRRTPAYVEFSSGMVYKPPSSSVIAAGGCTETAELKPWLRLANYKLEAERAVERTSIDAAKGDDGLPPGSVLNYAILRLAHVYGDYDVGFLARGLCLARVYQARHDKMEWLYGKELRINTVHVRDVCSAAWKAAEWAAHTPLGDPELATERGGRIFNVVDDGQTRQETVAAVVAALFEIETGFHSLMVSTFARFHLEKVVDDINEEVLQPWADLLAEKGITRQGPIGPFMEKEVLRDCDLSLSAARAKRVLGWRPEPGREKMTKEAVRDVIESYKRMGWWP